MCGIAGFTLSPLDQDTVETDRLTKMLALRIEHRGKDATGVARVSKSGRVKVSKAAQSAWTFFSQRPGLGSEAVSCLIHTRLATQGDPSDNVNNHPIQTSGLVGVHNGMIFNDWELYHENKTWDRYGKVDSEAIFAAVANKGWKDGLEAIEGSAAVAWVDFTEPKVLHLARHESSPLWIAMNSNGSLLFASEKQAIDAVKYLFGDPKEQWEERFLDEGTYVAYNAEDFDFLAWEAFKPPVGKSYTYSGSTTYGGGWVEDPFEGSDRVWYPTGKASEPRSGSVVGSAVRSSAASATDDDAFDDDSVTERFRSWQRFGALALGLGDQVWYKPHPDVDCSNRSRASIAGIIKELGRTLCQVDLCIDEWTIVRATVEVERLTPRGMFVTGLDNEREMEVERAKRDVERENLAEEAARLQLALDDTEDAEVVWDSEDGAQLALGPGSDEAFGEVPGGDLYDLAEFIARQYEREGSDA